MQCVKIWITKQGMFVTSVPKTRLVFTDRYHPLGFASVLRVFVVGVSNFRPAIWLLRSRWKRQQNILWNTGMSLSPWSYNAACFHWHTDIPLVFLSLLRVFVAALRNFWATTKHRFRVSTLVRRPRSVSFLRLMWCWTRVFYFQFLQQTVRKLCLVASDPARILSIFFPSLWGVPSIWRSCRLSATFFRLGGHVMQLYIGGKMLGEQA